MKTIVKLIFLFAFMNSKANNYQQLYDTCISHIKKYEGFRSSVYFDSNGDKLIGYGHKLYKNEYYNNITKQLGDSLLRKDFNKMMNKVQKVTKLENNRLLAITLFVYNVGIGTFLNSSVYKAIINNKPIDCYILRYGYYYTKYKEKIKSNKLISRRQFELWLYNL